MALKRFEMDNLIDNRSLSSLSHETFAFSPSIDAPLLRDLLATQADVPKDDAEFLASLLEFLSDLPDPPARAFLSCHPNIDLDSLLDYLYELDDDPIEDWLIGNSPYYGQKLYEGLEYYLQLSDAEISALAR